ncbi:hypothetical protein [Vreelandella boliviensis]|uniref:Phasin domain-containing protein n=1 Tax=Vreelandella boliviensis LC1 TaxID=1072583 RepID=A0A265DT86_9GAMM|nr:hypothetical protein [Halomonas boliviensis]EHJ91792.1 hypothetical protein KUC_3349 [Halomonas boliviensis LC1]OZT72539.1 hypothetical protein CE457_18895 [Halomonas boliviensis LC1]
MTTSAFPKVSPNAAKASIADNNEVNNNVIYNKDLLALWYQPWAETSNSAAKLQCIWLETLNDAFRHEIDFLATMAPVYSKLTHCMLGLNGPLTPESMASCYHQIAGDMSEATFNRMRNVSELSEDFKERIWCEL